MRYRKGAYGAFATSVALLSGFFATISQPCQRLTFSRHDVLHA